MSMGGSGNGRVQVAYIHPNRVSYSWHESMRRLRQHDAEHDGRLVAEPNEVFCAIGQLVEARNFLVRRFLDESDHEWLWMVDADMGFKPDTVHKLLEVADPATRPVVGALCFAMHFQAYDGMGGQRVQIVPTLYRIGKETKTGHTSFSYFGDYPPDTVVQVAATGAACLLVHRSALEKVRAEHGDHWFDQVVAESGKTVGEDFSFCLRLGGAGIPVHVHTGVPTNHHKEVWLSEYEYLRSIGAPDVEDLVPKYVPPATQETAVIVPVLGRPDNAAPFMVSLRASTGLATAYAICDADDFDTQSAWRDAGAQVIVAAHTFAEKVNVGYGLTAEPWLFLVGDDVRFHPGWLDHAQYLAARTGAKVIGTNDLGSERVQKGDHATHLLVAREYIDQQGASWDGPGVVAHEGYSHWFVDDEIVTAAKDRGVWAAALDSVVEHLHPMFGKADDDDVYQLGRSSAEADKARFVARLEQHDPGGGDASAGV